MSSSLPSVALACCSPECTEPLTVEVPGPPGGDGTPGTPGAAGPAAYTTFTAAFTMPAELLSAVATLANTSWMAVNQIVYAAKTDGSVIGTFQVTAIGSSVSATLKNLENTATGAYPANSAPGSIFPIGSMLTAAGYQGPGGSLTGAAGGDLKGTYPNPKIGIGNTKGSILAGNGTDIVAVPAGTNGHMVAYDSTDAEGVKSFKAIPITGDTNAAQNRLVRLSAATGLPIPLEPSAASLRNVGSAGVFVVSDIAGQNARGTDAIDLQSSVNAVTQVAAGNESVIGGGRRNTASGVRSVVAGGDSSIASAQEAAVGGGSTNNASGDRSTIGGGDSNVTSAQEATVAGGNHNSATGTQCAVGGGDTNTAGPGVECTVAGGGNNTATVANATVGGGDTCNATAQAATVAGGAQNNASGAFSSIIGGTSNVASGPASSVLGGYGAIADLYGEVAHAAGPVVVGGDAQVSEIIWVGSTVNATPTEIFLGLGTGQRATLADSRTWGFSGYMTVRKDDGTSAFSKFEGLIKRGVGVGTTALVGVTNTLLQDQSGGTYGAAGAYAFTADVANGALKLTVTGVGATNLHWMAAAKLFKLG